MSTRITLRMRAEIAAAQAEQHDPRSDGTAVMWQRAMTYALMAHGPAGEVDFLAFTEGGLSSRVEALLPAEGEATDGTG
jgi:hypothetical protein